MIVLQFDAVYLRWGVLLLRSLALHEPRKRVLADTVGLSPAQAREVREAHPKVIVRETAPRRPPDRTRMANRKCLVLDRVMDEYPREPWYCLMDADFLVRRPLTPLWSAMRWADAALLTTPGLRRRPPDLVNGVWSSLMLVRLSARPLVDRWVYWHGRRSIAGFRRGVWWWDCVTLAKARLETPLRYALVSFPEHMDDRLRPDSSIWSANAPPAEKDGIYRRFLAEHGRQRAGEIAA